MTIDTGFEHIIAMAKRFLTNGDLAAAEHTCDQALQKNPSHLGALKLMENILAADNRLGDAEQYYDQATKAAPDAMDIQFHHGRVAQESNQHQKAVRVFEKILKTDPENTDAHLMICESLLQTGDPETAHRHALIAGEKTNYNAKLLPYLYNSLTRVADFTELEKYKGDWQDFDRTAGRLLPATLLNYLSRAKGPVSQKKLFDLHVQWGQQIADQAATIKNTKRKITRLPEKIKIGFVSSDFYQHPVGEYFLPLITGLQNGLLPNIEIFCYATNPPMDDDKIRTKIKKHATQFRSIYHWPLAQILELIEHDQIDILIDLNGHTPHSCTSLLAFQPAPIVGLWMGYAYTTGLQNVDFVIADQYCRPPRGQLMTEKIITLDAPVIIKPDLSNLPEITQAPCEKNNYITFGTLNRPDKMTPQTLDLWAEILSQLPTSKFLIVRPECDIDLFKKNITAAFTARNIAADRLILKSNPPGKHLQMYNQMDISLDTTPLTGGATTIDSLMMGVPVITKVGDQMFSRLSYASLNYVGLNHLCAFEDKAYIQVATGLATNKDALSTLRQNLRHRIQTSPLCDLTVFCHSFAQTMQKITEKHIENNKLEINA